MSILVALWWLLFCTAFGLCVGSFLNAIIYRLPRQGSIRTPTWSACPHCGQRIGWYDNLPILSFVLLRGRCRHCRVPIATRYVVVEASMAVIVLMLLDAFFIGQVRSGVCANGGRFGLTDDLASDWQILLAHVILFACLLSMSAIDLEHYWVDVRFTNAATIVGFVLHTLWTPKHSAGWIRPFDTTAVMAILAIGGLGVVWLVLRWRPAAAAEPLHGAQNGAEPLHGAKVPTGKEAFGDGGSSPAETCGPPPSRAFGWAASLVLLGLFAVLLIDSATTQPTRHVWRAMVPMVLFFLLILRENTVVRQSDQEIVDSIEGERHTARRTVLGELALLVPAILLAGAGLVIMTGDGELPRLVSETIHHRMSGAGLPILHDWAPLMGFATAATGYVIAGAFGWAIRIVFTLGFGKEALGIGDIHLMAAAGCVAGWPVAVLGFFLTCFLALVGWVLTLPFKRSRALPLGPWLSLSFLAVVVFYEPVLSSTTIRHVIEAAQMLFLQNSQPWAVEVGG